MSTTIGGGGITGILIPKGGTHSGLSHYSPISTLERQYGSTTSSGSGSITNPATTTTNSPPSNNSILLFIKTNGTCCMTGIEQVLKPNSQQQPNLSDTTNSTTTTTLDSNINPFTYLNTPTNAEQQQQARVMSVPMSGGYGDDDNNGSNAYDNNNNNDLNDEFGIGTTGTTKKRTGGGFMGTKFLSTVSKVANKTAASLERSMQSLAVRADQGRNPDQMIMGLYHVLKKESPYGSITEEEFLINATEPQLIPTSIEQKQKGIRFVIPLVVPTIYPDGGVESSTIVIKLWIRGGASLLGAMPTKYHLLGSSSLDVQGLQQQLRMIQQQQQQTSLLRPFFFKLKLTSRYFGHDGELFVTAVPDYKYPPVCSNGWSLVDPLPNQQYPNNHYNVPLHQPYGFDVPNKVHGTLLTVERSMESALILPVAAAVNQLVHQSCLISVQHALSVQQMLLSSRHDAPAVNGGPYVETVVHVSHIQLNDYSTNNINPVACGSESLQPYTVGAYWQRPNSIFEVEVLPPSKVPLQPLPLNQLNNTIHFYPKPLRTGILPAIFQAAGGKVPAGTGFFLGTLRIQITVPTTTSTMIMSTTTGAASSSRFTKMMNPQNIVPENPFDSLCLPSQQQPSSSSTLPPSLPQQQQYNNPTTNASQQQPPLYSSTANNSSSGGGNNYSEIWECLIPLESMFQEFQTNPTPNTGRGYPIMNGLNQMVGTIFLNVQQMEMKQQNANTVATHQSGGIGGGASSASVGPQQRIPARGGLTQLMGLDASLLDGVLPALDFDEASMVAPPGGAGGTSSNMTPEEQRRRNQLLTMGDFMTYAYLNHHINFVRKQDTEFFHQRAREYLSSIHKTLGGSSASSSAQEVPVPNHQDHTPKPFRPSSSRSEMLLSGIPFNVHVASLAIDVLDSPQQPPPVASDGSSSFFVNITCGAPADHARDFGNVFATKKDANTPTQTVGLQSPVGPASGGLRRLETKRNELAQEVANLQTHLIMGIGNFFMEQRGQEQHQFNQPNMKPTAKHHIPEKHVELQALRWKVYEAVQCLHHLTWTCAVRRASVFSQALGIAVTSYLASLSDPSRTRTTWPAVWVQHGYLVCFEGLLSAVGKELGMMEDASVGIAMLRMVRVVLVPDDSAGPTSYPANSVPVPQAPYVKWVSLVQSTPESQPASKINSTTEFILQIGIAKSYYNDRIPPVLQNGTAVRFYPLLFEVGVDIRQWSANTGSNIMKRGTTTTTNTATMTGIDDPNLTTTEPSSADEDDEDTVGVTDDDVLVQLNYEAFQKMNEYAYTVAPASPASGAIPNNLPMSNRPNQPHPYLAVLYQHIVSSSGKMNHDILDEAATLAQQLGGGGVVFCKSGKDRTAMHVTYKQAQFLNQIRKKVMNSTAGGTVQPPTIQNHQVDEYGVTTTPMMIDTTLEDATILRIYGTRLPICEKNVGQAKYAFNSLQVKFMPEALKPPTSTLAGFLKGGKVFGGGGIET